jgi:hypothetical protein
MEEIVMINAISSLSPSRQPQQAAPLPDAQEAKTTPLPKEDTVTISTQGKQAVQLLTSGSTPVEETKESPIQKAIETYAGKK